MTTTTRSPDYSRHAVVQLDTGTVYGIGDDLAHARADARRGFTRAHVEDIDDAMAQLSDARITPAAAALVERVGGAPMRDLSWGTLPGTHVTAICLVDEE